MINQGWLRLTKIDLNILNKRFLRIYKLHLVDFWSCYWLLQITFRGLKPQLIVVWFIFCVSHVIVVIGNCVLKIHIVPFFLTLFSKNIFVVCCDQGEVYCEVNWGQPQVHQVWRCCYRPPDPMSKPPLTILLLEDLLSVKWNRPSASASSRPPLPRSLKEAR